MGNQNHVSESIPESEYIDVNELEGEWWLVASNKINRFYIEKKIIYNKVSRENRSQRAIEENVGEFNIKNIYYKKDGTTKEIKGITRIKNNYILQVPYYIGTEINEMNIDESLYKITLSNFEYRLFENEIKWMNDDFVIIFVKHFMEHGVWILSRDRYPCNRDLNTIIRKINNFFGEKDMNIISSCCS